MSQPHEEEIRRLFDDCERSVKNGDWQKVIEACAQLLKLLENVNDELGIGRIRLRLGGAYEESGRSADAHREYQLVCRIGETLGDAALQAAALHRQGHLLRMNDPAAARCMFEQSRALNEDDAEGRALCLAMMGQIDFTEGDGFSGLDTMLQALAEMPIDAKSRQHLTEHIIYFGSKLPRADYLRLVGRQIEDEETRRRLLEASSADAGV